MRRKGIFTLLTAVFMVLAVGAWSSGMGFTVTPVGGVPGAATQISPSGTISTATPTYTWNAVSDATYYQLWVNDSGIWYTASDVGCSSGTGTCSITGSALTAGSYTWYVQTYNSTGVGPWSSGMGFTVTPVGGVPGAATQISPSGTISTATPTYTWNAVSDATYYQLWVNDSGTWYTASEADCSSGTCSITGSVTAGSYTWFVQTYNSTGVGAWSSGMGFTVTLLPGAPTQISPSGTIATTTPTYTWNAVSDASYYYLWNGTAATWYSASAAGCGSGTGTCSITGSALADGSYTWYVQTYNSYGYGLWSSGMDFTVTLLPGAATQISPSGPISTATPTYKWNAVSNATYYRLWVNGSGTWYTASDVDCGSGSGTCSITGSALADGSYTWYVQTWNSYGYGLWSSGMGFTVTLLPGAATQISPSGTIATTTPTYTWNAVSDAAYYYLWNGTAATSTWYAASEAGCGSGSGSGTCSITGSALAEGSYTWYVQTYNSYGYGLWSSGMGFTIAAPKNMVLIPAGSFQMGDAIDGISAAMPVHTVTVSAFYLDKYEVTKAFWDEVYTWAVSHGYSFDNAGSGSGANHPVQNVTWYDVVKWLNARSEKEGRTPVYYTDAGKATVYRTGRVKVAAGAVKWQASGYRLPTEAEWEYAARAGTTTRFYTEDCISTDQANYNGNYPWTGCPSGQYRRVTTVVGSFVANPWGLYDMAGNVWEWTWDWFDLYSSSSATNPQGPDSGSYRVRRGGGWNDDADNLRSAVRGTLASQDRGFNLGFRSALSQP